MRHEMLVEAMDSLNEREKHILTERRLTDDPQTLEELSQVYDVSRERIRQIEVRAFEKLQKAMQRIAGERLLPLRSPPAKRAETKRRAVRGAALLLFGCRRIDHVAHLRDAVGRKARRLGMLPDQSSAFGAR